MTGTPPPVAPIAPSPQGSDAPLALIMSGAYVEQELAAEFGHLPPSFLPVGTRRLYEYQRSHFPADATVHLALPESFSPPLTDRILMQRLGLAPLPLALLHRQEIFQPRSASSAELRP